MIKLANLVIATLLQGCCVASLFCFAGCATTTPSEARKTNSETNRLSAGMVLDLGAESDYVQVTSEYSDAVLVALLPYFSDFARKLDLPVPQPITQADVARFNVMPYRHVLSASVTLRNGWVFDSQYGYVDGFVSPHEIMLSDKAFPNYGEIKISRADAIKTAETMLKKLCIPPEDVFADHEPQVTLPVTNGTNVVCPYRIQWMNPFGDPSVDIKIDPNTGKIDRADLRSPNLVRPPPKIAIVPPFEPNSNDWFTSHIPPQKINPEYARQLVPMMFKAIDDYARKLSLPVPLPLTTNNVARVQIHNNGGWPHCYIETTNGWQFIYRHTMVNGYYDPTALNVPAYRALRVKNFEGKWNLNTNQAIALVGECPRQT